MVRLAAYGVGQAVIADIYQQIDIVSPNRFVDDSLGLSRAKARACGSYDERISVVSCEGGSGGLLARTLLSPLYNVIIHPVAHIPAAL